MHDVEPQYESGDAWNEKDWAQLWPLCFELRLCELTWDPACISVHLRVRVRVYVRRAHRALMIAPKAMVLHIHNKLYHTCEMLHVRAKDTVYAQLLDELLDEYFRGGVIHYLCSWVSVCVWFDGFLQHEEPESHIKHERASAHRAVLVRLLQSS